MSCSEKMDRDTHSDRQNGLLQPRPAYAPFLCPYLQERNTHTHTKKKEGSQTQRCAALDVIAYRHRIRNVANLSKIRGLVSTNSSP